MRLTAKVWMPALFVFALTMVGCDKTVSYTFTNVTDRPADLVLLIPGDDLGSFSLPPSGQLTHKVKLPKDDLPAACELRCGKEVKSFTITEDTRDKQWFDVTNDGIQGPRDNKMTVVKKREVEYKKPIPVETHSVPMPD
jgi:hypothetical protein